MQDSWRSFRWHLQDPAHCTTRHGLENHVCSMVSCCKYVQTYFNNAAHSNAIRNFEHQAPVNPWIWMVFYVFCLHCPLLTTLVTVPFVASFVVSVLLKQPWQIGQNTCRSLSLNLCTTKQVGQQIVCLWLIYWVAVWTVIMPPIVWHCNNNLGPCKVQTLICQKGYSAVCPRMHGRNVSFVIWDSTVLPCTYFMFYTCFSFVAWHHRLTI